MTVLRHYFISDDLDDLEVLEEELEAKGVETPQIHVVSLDEPGVDKHVHLHSVTSFEKTDVIRSGEWGASVGLIGAILILVVTYFAGWHTTRAGWLPFIFLAIITLGFCTWEGAFIGIQRTNKHFKRFEKALKQGKHLFFVDLLPEQEGILDQLLKRHPSLELAGTERGTPHWIMVGQKLLPHPHHHHETARKTTS